MRTVSDSQTSLFEEPVEDEQFTDGTVIDLIKSLMGANRENVIATVSAEWERKSATVRGPLDDPHSYRHHPATDDLVLTLELRIDGYARAHIGAVGELEHRVRTIVAEREEARTQAKAAALEAEAAAAMDAYNAAQQKLEELRAQR